ncbi:hypothetical protein D3C73_1650910 [compost metagenome]
MGVDKGGDALADGLAHGFVEGADGQLQFDAVGDDIGKAPAMDGADGDDGGLQRIYVS